MNAKPDQKDKTTNSPFHHGEQQLQALNGTRDSTERLGRQVIRNYMPEQHREFYQNLPYIVVGSVDNQQWPWASILFSDESFIRSPDASTLCINTKPVVGDPINDALSQSNAPLGVLGIDLSNRRRNRVNGRLSTKTDSSITMTVDQSFGNCPQYIQTRKIERKAEQAASPVIQQELINQLDEKSRSLIQTADTFFVSSFIHAENQPEIQGVDVSHRGGQPGFIKVEGNTLTIPDYSGNNHFNTLGNFLLNPKAGLLFIDFDSGDLLMLTGAVELIWQQTAELAEIEGAERGWRFTLDHGVKLTNALPFKLCFEQYAPSTMITGIWNDSAKTKTKQKRQLRVTDIKQEADSIKSFYLEPIDGKPLDHHLAGQYLTLSIPAGHKSELINRTYTLSSLPSESRYRISVKEELSGAVSGYLHNQVKLNDIIDSYKPAGKFTLDQSHQGTMLFIAAGIGVTPVLSMISTLLENNNRAELPDIRLIYQNRSSKSRAFHSTLKELEKHSRGRFHYISVLSQPTTTDDDFTHSGYLSRKLIEEQIQEDSQVYLCGPTGFMQSAYDQLIEAGITDQQIKAESFGPSTLKRSSTEKDTTENESDHALVVFRQSNKQQSWQKKGSTLLEIAEQLEIPVESGCRTGRCGSCATKLKSGKVIYRTDPNFETEKNQVLICCAVPAKGYSKIELEL